MARTFTSNEQFAGVPIDVVQGHEHNLTGAEPKSGQNEQDGEIAAASSSLPIALAEQPPPDPASAMVVPRLIANWVP